MCERKRRGGWRIMGISSSVGHRFLSMSTAEMVKRNCSYVNWASFKMVLSYNTLNFFVNKWVIEQLENKFNIDDEKWNALNSHR